MSQGANTQAVWGFEETGGVSQPGQKAGTLYGIRFHDFQFLVDPSSERTKNMDPRGQLLPARNGFYNLPFTTGAEFSVDDIARFRAHLQGMATLTNVAAGVNDFALRDKISTDAPSVAFDTVSLEVDRDDGYAQLLLNCALDSWVINVKGGKIVDHKLSGMACRFTHMRDPQTVVGPATYTGTVYVRGNRQDADAEDTTNDLKFKVTTAGALDGTGKIKMTKGATAYGSIEYPVVAGVWMDFILADGTHASGDQLNPVQIMFTLGTGSLTAGGTPDEWKIQAKRPKVTPTYPSRNPLIGVKAIVTIGGVVYDVEDFDIELKRPRKYRRASSSPFPSAILPDGTRSWSIKIKKDYLATERALYLAMLSASSKTLDITINGDFIATVATVSYYEKHQFVSSKIQVIKAGSNVPNDKQLPEAIEIVPAWDGSNVELSETVRCTLATLK